MSLFQFKKFSIKQEHSAAKVGTDGVLLGAWTPLDPKPKTILDIGAGTGLISLMLAQRSKNSLITAIESEPYAFEECKYNFNQSLWNDRLNVQLIDFKQFTPLEKFDLIVSNPPFYTEDMKSINEARTQARSTIALPFEILIKETSDLLAKNGNLSLVIPYSSEEYVIELGKQSGLYVNQICHVKGHENAPIKRSLMCLSGLQTQIKKEELVLEINRHEYTEDYKKLTREFYLKM